MDDETPFNRHAPVVPAATLDIEAVWRSDNETRSVGRPSKYEPDFVERILSALRRGVSLEDLCDRDDMPCTATIYNWGRKYPEFAADLEEARVYGTEHLNQRAKSALMGGRYSTGDRFRDVELAKHIRWEISKRNRMVFGDRLDLTSAGKAITITYSDDMALALGDPIDAEFSDVIVPDEPDTHEPDRIEHRPDDDDHPLQS